MVGRGEVTDTAWTTLEPLLPDNGGRGQQWRDHRQVINGILWKLRTGAPWRDLPERSGPWRTVYARFVRWQEDETWDRLLADVQTKSDAVGDVIWVVSIDSSVVRAHQHAAGARKRGAASSDEAIGRSRGGLTTKLHLACDGQGRPLSIVLTPGQWHDSTPLEPVLDAIRVPRPGGQGRPRKQPDHLIGDKGSSYALPAGVTLARHPAHRS